MKNIIIAILFIPFLLTANSADDLFQQGNEQYSNKQYSDAINTYEQILDNGSGSAELYFNLANAYYKTDNIAYAILNYERADKLSDSEDIDHNLTIARLKTIDKVERVEQIFIVDWIDAIRNLQNSTSWAWWTVGFVWVLFVFAGLLIYSRSTAIKKLSVAVIFATLVMSILLSYLAYSSHQNEYVKKFAILTEQSTYVKSSPDTQSQDLFILHAGVKMQVLDSVGEWRKIRLDNGEIGWVDSGTFTVI